MDDADLVANAYAVVNAIEKKLPNGDKNIRRVMIKPTMGKIVKEPLLVKK